MKRVALLLAAVALSSACGGLEVSDRRSALATLSLDALSLVGSSDLDPLGPCGFAEGVGPERDAWVFFRPDGKRACSAVGPRSCSFTALAGVAQLPSVGSSLVASLYLSPSSERRETVRIDAVALGAGTARLAANPAVYDVATDGSVSVAMRDGWSVGAFALAVTFTVSFQCTANEASKTQQSSFAVGRVSVSAR